MDSTTMILLTPPPSFSLSKGLTRHFTKNSTHSLLLPIQLCSHRSSSGISFFASSSCFDSRRGLHQPTRRPECLSSLASSFGGGGGGDGSDGGGGGDGGPGSGDAKASPFAAAEEDLLVLSLDAIVLNGMTCGGCATSVKKILESQPLVSSASVNLTTKTAIVWPVSEAEVSANWQKQLGEELAKHLTNCGFQSKLQRTSQELEEQAGFLYIAMPQPDKARYSLYMDDLGQKSAGRKA